jgi:hypothetical protein
MSKCHGPTARSTSLLVLFLLVCVLLLNGCKPNTNGHGNAPEPQPTPTPAPTPEPVVMDEVVRADAGQIRHRYLTFYNGAALQSATNQAASVVLWTDDNTAETLYVPLRALANTMNKPVRWNGRRRRVFFNDKKAPEPLLLMGGRSYLDSERLEQWLGCTVDWRRFDKDNPHDETGIVEINRKKNHDKPD